jgi:hypothetical protein
VWTVWTRCKEKSSYLLKIFSLILFGQCQRPETTRIRASVSGPLLLRFYRGPQPRKSSQTAEGDIRRGGATVQLKNGFLTGAEVGLSGDISAASLVRPDVSPELQLLFVAKLFGVCDHVPRCRYLPRCFAKVAALILARYHL